jgi:hypothetical protein
MNETCSTGIRRTLAPTEARIHCRYFGRAAASGPRAGRRACRAARRVGGGGPGLGEPRLQAADRVGEPGVLERLDEIVDGALLERLHRVVLVRGDEDDLRAPGDRPRRVDAAASRHVHVEERDARPQLLEELDRLAPVARLGDDLELRPEPVQVRAQLLAQERFVVGDQRGRRGAFAARLPRGAVMASPAAPRPRRPRSA